jgi:hypothetical protein
MPGSSVLQVRVSGKFAFAEFRSIEECNLGMNLKGAHCQGQILDVKRPSKYVGPPTPFVTYPEYVQTNKPSLFDMQGAVGLPEGGAAAAMSAGDPNTKMLRELYIGNVPPQMNESQLQMFFNQQMTMRQLAQGPGNPCVQCRISNGFAFAEFRSVDETNLAVAHLNNVEVMGTQLRVGRPKKYEDQVPIEEQQRVMREAKNAQMANMSRMQDPTNCLQLSNMITAAELADAEERADIQEDIKMELTKYGEVKDIQLPTEGPGTCNVYVKFTEVQQARVARAALQGRKFGEGSVDVWFYDPSKFESRTWEDMKVVVSSALHCTACLLARVYTPDCCLHVRVHVCVLPCYG